MDQRTMKNLEDAIKRAIGLTAYDRMYEAIELIINARLSGEMLMERSDIDDVCNEYTMMREFWAKGYSDEHRNDIANALKRKIHVALADVLHNIYRQKYALFDNDYRYITKGGREWSMESVANNLEKYVTDMALAELNGNALNGQRQAQMLGDQHAKYMDDLFTMIWTSKQWPDSYMTAMSNITTNPIYDANDQQMIVSAIMVGCLLIFDINKYSTLFNTLKNSSNEHVRNRALIALLLIVESAERRIYPQIKEMVTYMAEHYTHEIAEIQMQVIYCVGAEDDTQKIQKEIMPDIIKGAKIKDILANDPLAGNDIEEILGSEDFEGLQDKMMESITQMQEKQKEGVDIYFGGFSRMKGNMFFSVPNHWFMPFNYAHPALTPLRQAMGDNGRFIETMPFCNSDKYSFAIEFARICNNTQVTDLFRNGELLNMTKSEQMAQTDNSPSTERLFILQDIYRFFKLSPYSKVFTNPMAKSHYEGNNYLFLTNVLFQNTPISNAINDIIGTCFKKKKFNEATYLLFDRRTCTLNDFDYYMACAYAIQNVDMEQCTVAKVMNDEMGYLKAALEIRYDDKALAAYALAAYKNNNIELCIESYTKLSAHKALTNKQLMRMAICHCKLDDYDAAAEILYKLDFEIENNPKIRYYLALTCMWRNKIQQAINLLESIDISGNSDAECLLAIARWHSGDINGASDLFVQSLKDNDKCSNKSWESAPYIYLMSPHLSLIKHLGIDDVNRDLMSSYIYNKV